MRNFWITGKTEEDVDHKVDTFSLTIYQLHHGTLTVPTVIHGEVIDRVIILTVRNEHNQVVIRNLTQRG